MVARVIEKVRLSAVDCLTKNMSIHRVDKKLFFSARELPRIEDAEIVRSLVSSNANIVSLTAEKKGILSRFSEVLLQWFPRTLMMLRSGVT